MGEGLFRFLKETDVKETGLNADTILLAQEGQGGRRKGGSIADDILNIGRKPTDNGTRPATPAESRDTNRPAEIVQSPSDRQTAAPVDATVELDFKNIDATQGRLNTLFFDKIVINNLHKDVRISHWADDSGHFFFFKPGSGVASTDKGTHYELRDGTKVPKGHFYYSPYATKLTVADQPGAPGGTQDLTQQRAAVDTAYQQSTGKPHKAYEAYERNYKSFASLNRGGDPIGYMRNVAGLGDKALSQQTQMLEELAKTSTNPYVKIYLADMYVAQAMLPIIKPLTSGQGFSMNSPDIIRLNNPETIRKLDQAIEVLKSVREDSGSSLEGQNMRTRPNVVLPLSPFASRNNRDGYYHYWGGSYDQAAHRELQVQTLKNLIRIMPVLELPPIQPPR
ncbi:MAG: hypothetical protein K8F91_18320 [Candidatus Obscuribacterales bacterium]|nr:hypothetical protein [Candidatus Obscuribacterales bacterium]